MEHIVAHRRRRGSNTYKTVKSGDSLRQTGRANAGSDLLARKSAKGPHDQELGVDGRRGLHRKQGCGQTHTYATHSEEVGQARGRLFGHSGDTANASQARREGDSGRKTGTANSHQAHRAKGTADDARWNQVIMPVLWRIVRPPEHVQHFLRDNKAAYKVDGGENDSGSRKGLRSRARHDASPKLQHSSDNGHSRDSVGDTHQRRMEGVGDSTDSLGPNPDGESEGWKHASSWNC
mmetsp:Transcript_13850/g.19225  ORF Transcript_13850/g.19225 Transcript_13850/m.19225 type:complete len:235 (-) Transcript_13850:1284-1988(-)